MATKQANITALIAAGMGAEEDFTKLPAKVVQNMRDMFAPESVPAANPRESHIAALVIAGMGAPSDFDKLPDTVLANLASKVQTGPTAPAGKPKDEEVPAEVPALELETSAVVTYLQTATPQESGYWAMPLSAKGTAWTAEAHRRNVSRICRAAGIVNWSDIAPLFVQGSLPIAQLLHVAAEPLRDSVSWTSNGKRWTK